MDWEYVKLILEIIGTIAIIVTLIYLAIQIRDNTRIAAANARQSISESLLGNTITYFSDLEFRKTFNIHYQFRNNLVSNEDWAAFRRNLKALCQTPALRNFWNRESDNFNKSFHGEVSKIFSELEHEPKLMPDALFQPKNND